MKETRFKEESLKDKIFKISFNKKKTFKFSENNISIK